MPIRCMSLWCSGRSFVVVALVGLVTSLLIPSPLSPHLLLAFVMYSDRVCHCLHIFPPAPPVHVMRRDLTRSAHKDQTHTLHPVHFSYCDARCCKRASRLSQLRFERAVQITYHYELHGSISRVQSCGASDTGFTSCCLHDMRYWWSCHITCLCAWCLCLVRARVRCILHPNDGTAEV